MGKHGIVHPYIRIIGARNAHSQTLIGHSIGIGIVIDIGIEFGALAPALDPAAAPAGVCVFGPREAIEASGLDLTVHELVGSEEA